MATRSWFSRASEMTADLLIATVLAWSLPLFLGVTVALLTLLARSF